MSASNSVFLRLLGGFAMGDCEIKNVLNNKQRAQIGARNRRKEKKHW